MIVIILPDISTEDQLLARARQGDLDALRQIYQDYAQPVYQFIRMRVADRLAAEDIASEVFFKLVRECKAGRAPHHSLRGWLFRVARSELHDHYGKNQRFTNTVLNEFIPAPSEHEPEVEFIRSLRVEMVRVALRQLSFDQQEVIILRFGQRLSLQETADLMGRNANAIKALQFRAINALRRALGQMRAEVELG